MAMRFRKSKTIAPGVRLHVGKKSASVSLGGRGKSVSIGKQGVYANVGIPGSGLSYRQKISGSTSSLNTKKGRYTSSAVYAIPEIPEEHYHPVIPSQKGFYLNAFNSVLIIFLVVFLVIGIFSHLFFIGAAVCLVLRIITGTMYKNVKDEYKRDRDEKIEQLKKQYEEWLSIVNECGTVLSSTLDPEQFFSNLEKLEEYAGLLAEYNVPLTDEYDAETLYNEFMDSKEQSISDFLTKAYNCLEEPDKASKRENYFVQIEKFKSVLSGENSKLVEKLKEEE